MIRQASSDSADDLIRLGDSLLRENRFTDARDCFRRAGCRFGEAVSLQLAGHFLEAEAAYARVLAEDPLHRETLSNLIAMSVEAFDLERVHAYALRLLELEPESAIALQALAMVSIERRDFESAAEFFSRIEAANIPRGADAIEYRVSRDVVERLRRMHGTLARPD
jgi:tetratricopeptide (TPR) repeat protein